MKKIAVFADVQNLYYTVRQAYGCHFNYAALWADISKQGDIVEAYAYAIDRGDSKQQQFQQILRNLGFVVKLKPYICLLYTSPSPRDRQKSRMPSSA